MGYRNMIGPSAYLQVKALHEKGMLTGKNKIFSTAAILRTGCRGGSHVASGGLAWPGSGVALGVTESLVGLKMVLRAAGGLLGSWVAIGCHGWPLWVAVDLVGSQLTLITCQIFTNAPNFRIRKRQKAAELPSLFEVGRK
jgi:hypothetical protein